MSGPLPGWDQASFFDDEPIEEAPKATVDSPFTVIVDSSEQIPYRFEGITGDYRDDYAPIRVRTVRKRLKTGDYAILEFPGVAVERKSKEDLFNSIRNDERRENFLGRLDRMERDCRMGYVLVECTFEDIYTNPPPNSNLMPKAAGRTVISWRAEFPNVHWVFCDGREWAEQVCYRLLERHFLHETLEKHRSHNKLIRNALDDFQQGMLMRRTVNVAEIPYAPGSPRRDQWLLGWGYHSVHFCGGDLGKLYEKGEAPIGPVNPEEAEKRSKRSKRKKVEDDPIDVIGREFGKLLAS